MIDSILRHLFAPQPTLFDEPDAALALTALMVRVARSDGNYSGDEIAQIDRVLAERHRLDAKGAADLRAQAEVLEAAAPDTVRFTRALKAAVPLDQRKRLVGALWAVALADGRRDAEEDRLLRLVASLLGLTDVESALARQKAERR